MRYLLLCVVVLGLAVPSFGRAGEDYSLAFETLLHHLENIYVVPNGWTAEQFVTAYPEALAAMVGHAAYAQKRFAPSETVGKRRVNGLLARARGYLYEVARVSGHPGAETGSRLFDTAVYYARGMGESRILGGLGVGASDVPAAFDCPPPTSASGLSAALAAVSVQPSPSVSTEERANSHAVDLLGAGPIEGLWTRTFGGLELPLTNGTPHWLSKVTCEKRHVIEIVAAGGEYVGRGLVSKREYLRLRRVGTGVFEGTMVQSMDPQAFIAGETEEGTPRSRWFAATEMALLLGRGQSRRTGELLLKSPSYLSRVERGKDGRWTLQTGGPCFVGERQDGGEPRFRVARSAAALSAAGYGRVWFGPATFADCWLFLAYYGGFDHLGAQCYLAETTLPSQPHRICWGMEQAGLDESVALLGGSFKAFVLGPATPTACFRRKLELTPGYKPYAMLVYELSPRSPVRHSIATHYEDGARQTERIEHPHDYGKVAHGPCSLPRALDWMRRAARGGGGPSQATPPIPLVTAGGPGAPRGRLCHVGHKPGSNPKAYAVAADPRGGRARKRLAEAGFSAIVHGPATWEDCWAWVGTHGGQGYSQRRFRVGRKPKSSPTEYAVAHDSTDGEARKKLVQSGFSSVVFGPATWVECWHYLGRERAGGK